MGNEGKGGGNLVRTAIVGESLAVAAHIRSQLDQDERFEVLWVCTPHLVQEYSLDGIDLMVRAGNFDELPEFAPGSSSAAVLYVCEELPAAITDLIAMTFPIGAVDPDTDAETLCAAAAALVRNLWVVSPALLKGSETSSTTELDADEMAALTPRESEVLVAAAAGMSNSEIAWELSISENTVKFHLSSIYGKLRVNNRVSAIRAAIDKGILDI